MVDTHKNKIKLLITITLLLVIQFTVYNYGALSRGLDILGTDPFTRLVRVQELYESGDWFDTTSDRSNYPFGEQSHWSRALDILLLLPALLLSPFLGFTSALELVGIWLSPLLGCVAIILLFYYSKFVITEDSRYLLLLIFLTQPMILDVFKFGRPDHHSLLMLTFLLTIGLTLKRFSCTPSRSLLIFVGVALAVSMWISVESIVLIAIVAIASGVSWILKRDGQLRELIVICSSLTLFSLLFLLSETRMASLFDTVYDKLSIVHILLFSLLTLVLFLTLLIGDKFKSDTKLTRFSTLLTLGLISLAVMYLLYPAFFKGPFADVNPAIKTIWLDHVSEVQPLVSFTVKGLGRLLIYLGLPFLGILHLVAENLKTKMMQPKYLFLLVGSIVYFLLSLYQIRWASYAIFITILPLTQLLKETLVRIPQRIKGFYQILLRNMTILVFLFLFTFTGLILMIDEESSQQALKENKLRLFCDWLASDGTSYTSEKTILSFLDFSPEILYRTRLNVIATPYHRNDEGILYAYGMLSSTTQLERDTLLEQRSVDFLLIVQDSNEKYFYQNDQNARTLYQDLLDDKIPDWLSPIPLPNELGEFKFFRID
ncbi:hypothetical protein DWB64_09945 [Fusibacter sp. A1]|nr:hypothetical protein DWB64_09945 [Fusibacter sp. A1]